MGFETSLENDQLSSWGGARARGEIDQRRRRLCGSQLGLDTAAASCFGNEVVLVEREIDAQGLPITSAVGLTASGAAATVVVRRAAGTPGQLPGGCEIPVVFVVVLEGCSGRCSCDGHCVVMLQEEVGRTGPETARLFLDVVRWQ